MNEVVDAEVVEESPGTEIELQDHDQTDARLALFGTTEAVGVLERATAIADALAPVIEKKKLFSNIQGRNHVRVEGWQTLGAMLGVFAVVTETKAITDDKGSSGWEARCEVRIMNGTVIGAADAQCSRSERTWSGRDDYAIRSMAQTRAISKALKGPLGFIVELAGYSATPAEEIPFQEQQGPPPIDRKWLDDAILKYGEEPILKAARALWPNREIWAVGNLADLPEQFRPTLLEHADALAQPKEEPTQETLGEEKA